MCELRPAHSCGAEGSQRQRLFFLAIALPGQGEQPLRQYEAAILVAPVVETIPKSARAGKRRFAIAQALGKPMGRLVVALDVARCIAARGEQGRPESQAQRQLLPVERFAFRHFGGQRQAVGQTLHRLEIGEAAHRAPPAPTPPFHRRLQQASLREMVGDDSWFRLRPSGKTVADRLGDPLMKLLTTALQKGRVGGVLHQRVFEHIGRIRAASPRP